jgi:urea transport system permease protein
LKTIRERILGGAGGSTNLLVLAALLILVLPLSLDIFRLNLVGKYLSFAFVALGLVMLWGKAGVLSLGQGVFFGLGGYCMAMFLKLEASDPESTKIQSTPGIPDFMDWNQITELPAFWVPFKSLSFSLLAVVVVPSIIAFIIGTAMFRRRVGGVYFAVITQALALILSLGIDSLQGYTQQALVVKHVHPVRGPLGDYAEQRAQIRPADHDQPAGGRASRNVGQRAPEVVNVFEHVDDLDKVELPLGVEVL